MSEQLATTRHTDGDPGGSIFLLGNERSIEDLERIRLQVVFGRGAYRTARLTAAQQEQLLQEIDNARVELLAVAV